MRASSSGGLNGLTTLLADDVVFWADGGGKVRGAALLPVRGRDPVARFISGLTARFMPQDVRFGIAAVNGRPTLLVHNTVGAALFVVSVEVDAGHIQSIWAIANPDKLGRVSSARLA